LIHGGKKEVSWVRTGGGGINLWFSNGGPSAIRHGMECCQDCDFNIDNQKRYATGNFGPGKGKL